MRKKKFSYVCPTCKETYATNDRPKDGKICAICSAIPSKNLVKLTVAISKLNLNEALAAVELAKRRAASVRLAQAAVIVVRYETMKDGAVRSGGMIYSKLSRLQKKYPAPKFQLSCAGQASLQKTSIGTIEAPRPR
ncbi:MAG TPA: hypothetical protein VFV82_06130 [Candidatus Binatia bacterium]|nr:hypothetical protein [Candidatus Binatia bacterium]